MISQLTQLEGTEWVSPDKPTAFYVTSYVVMRSLTLDDLNCAVRAALSTATTPAFAFKELQAKL